MTSAAPVPVTMGSPRFLTRDLESLRVIEAWFPPRAVLQPHTHDRSVFAMMLYGGFETRIGARSLQCPPGSSWTEPNAEKHTNHVGRGGAHVLVIQPNDRHAELFEPMRRLLDEVCFIQHPAVMCSAPRIIEALRVPGDARALAIEADVLALMSLAVGMRHRDGNGHRPPAWLLRVRQVLHDEWRNPPSLSQLAAIAGVHPCHLAHVFRDRLGDSIGSYVQRLRVGWAVGELANTKRSISQIAVDAGFWDQSHLTRQYVRLTRVTPAALRRAGGAGRRH
jgi:AraC family transcriptional regulator